MSAVSPRQLGPNSTWAFFVPWKVSTEIGGVNQVVLRLLNRCDRPLLVEDNWGEPYETKRFGFHAVGEKVRVPSGLRYLLALPDSFRRITALVRRHQIAVVNPHFPSTACVTFLLLRRWTGYKVFLSFHGSDIRTAVQSTGLQRMLYRWMLRSADAVVACSAGLLAEVRMLEPRIRGHVVHNGVDPLSTEGEPLLRREPGTEVILSVGIFQRRKGHDILLAAFRQIRKRRPQARLWLIGARGDALPEVQKLAAAFGDAVKILVDQPHDRLGATMAQADVFVLASRHIPGKIGEGFGIVVLEAGSVGLPVVSTRCCGPTEIIEDGVTGRLVPLEDPDEMAAAVEDLLSDESKRRRLGSALREHVLKNFRWEDAWNKYRKLAGQ